MRARYAQHEAMPCKKCGALHLCDDTEADLDLASLEEGKLSVERQWKLAEHLFRCEMHRIVFETMLMERGALLVHDGTKLQIVPDVFNGSQVAKHRA